MCKRYTATYTDYCETHALQRIAEAQRALVKKSMLFHTAVNDLKKQSLRGQDKWWKKQGQFTFYSNYLRGLSDELDAMSDAVDEAAEDVAEARRIYSLTPRGIAQNEAELRNPRLPDELREFVLLKHDEGLAYQKGVHRTALRKKKQASKPRTAKAGRATAA